MLRVVVCLGMVAMVMCQAPEPQPHKYCCTPRRWEGTEAGIGGAVIQGSGQVVSTIARVSFDGLKRRVYSYSNTTVGRNVYSFKVIQDYQKGVQYVIDVRKRACRKMNLTEEFNDGCIPDRARYIGPFYFGAGRERLDGKSYSARITSKQGLMDVMITVTPKQCIPISEALVGSSNGVKQVVSVGFTGITLGIRDPSVFNPPRFCTHDAKLSFPPTDIEQRFRTFNV